MAKTKGNSITKSVVDSASDMFDALEKGIEPQLTSDQEPKPEQAAIKPKVAEKEQVTPQKDSNSEEWEGKYNNLNKRYQDSSREAVRLKAINDENAKYSSLISVMKTDPNVAGMVKEYLETGGKPSQIAPQVSEDFIFDPDEAIRDPKSESAEVFSSVVRNIVKEEAIGIKKESDQKYQEIQKQRDYDQTQAAQRAQAEEWYKSKGMSKDQFVNMMDKAETINFDYDLINELVNRPAPAPNAEGQRQRIQQQMERAGSIPESPAATNSIPEEPVEQERLIMGALKELDRPFKEELFE
jgi:hypothetical protein